ncbi:MAG: hypothetical protein JXQ73_00625 [Phycisphaerae bacterium]|nr:hypothetical protein [Phycisphaerae bacterium]
MDDRIVINTGPLIAFARADALDVLRQLPIQFICPREVEQEIKAGAALGYPVVLPPWLTIIQLGNPLDPVALAALDPGRQPSFASPSKRTSAGSAWTTARDEGPPWQ